MLLHRLSALLLAGALSLPIAACDDADSPAPDTQNEDLTDTTEPEDDSSGTNSGGGGLGPIDYDSLIAPDADTLTADDEVPGVFGESGGNGIIKDTAAIATEDKDGFYRSVINATPNDAWAHISLSDGTLVVPAPEGDAHFHIGFQRILAKLGPDVEVKIVDDVPFAELTSVPTPDEGWLVDELDANDAGSYAMGGWWIYDFASHGISPDRNRIYIVRHGEQFWKLQYRDYYDIVGSAGMLTIDWAPLPAP